MNIHDRAHDLVRQSRGEMTLSEADKFNTGEGVVCSV